MGTVIYFAASTPPPGYLECNGQSTTGYPELAMLVGATVPDLRGEFIRGWTHNRTGTTDDGRSFGSWQSDQFKTHYIETIDATGISKPAAFASIYPITPWAFVPSNSTTNTMYPAGRLIAPGGAETRPRNIALLPCIRALP